MNIARYWATVDSEEIAPNGHAVPFTIRRGSDASEDDARRNAEHAAEQMRQRIRNGWEPTGHYDYAQRQLPEPIIDEVLDLDGQRIGAITINRYGCEVLNTLNLGFLDVDLHEVKQRQRKSRGGILSALFGRKKNRYATHAEREQTPEGHALEQLRTWVNARSQTGVRAYRTAAGLRYLFVQPRMNPAEALDVPIYGELGCDPLYQKLCVAQGCFRARLSPKPWRIGIEPPPNCRADKIAASPGAYERWRDGYNAKAAGYAVCAFIDSFGRADPPDDFTRHLIDMHDELTGAMTGLPLA